MASGGRTEQDPAELRARGAAARFSSFPLSLSRETERSVPKGLASDTRDFSPDRTPGPGPQGVRANPPPPRSLCKATAHAACRSARLTARTPQASLAVGTTREPGASPRRPAGGRELGRGGGCTEGRRSQDGGGGGGGKQVATASKDTLRCGGRGGRAGGLASADQSPRRAGLRLQPRDSRT